MAPPRRYEFGGQEEATHPDSIRATVAEFVSTFIFVFAGEGSQLALERLDIGIVGNAYTAGILAIGGSGSATGKLYGVEATTGASSLLLIAIAHAFGLFAAVAASLNVSGGHVNPAVTFGALVGGRVSFVRAILYWIAQLLGAIVAALLLKLSTDGMRPIGLGVAYGEGNFNALVLEIVLTFGLVYTVYATAIDPKRGSLGTIAPLAIALIVGANILVGGPFDGASMNPARAFGPALVGWRWRYHWIYWVGPLIGGGLAGIIYEFIMISREAPHTHQPLAPEDY